VFVGVAFHDDDKRFARLGRVKVTAKFEGDSVFALFHNCPFLLKKIALNTGKNNDG
jgi:hypothetical protein